jgi:type II secretory pathway component PulJ
MNIAELLVSTALFGLVSAMTLMALSQGLRVYADGVARVEAQQSARSALERIARDVRGAGYGGTAFPAVADTNPGVLVLQQDLDGDGVIAGSGETITWRLVTGVLRRDAGGGAQPVVNGARSLAFTYLDERGAATTAPADVRAVSITLTTGPTHASSQETAGLTTTVATEVRLRNR